MINNMKKIFIGTYIIFIVCWFMIPPFITFLCVILAGVFFIIDFIDNKEE